MTDLFALPLAVGVLLVAVAFILLIRLRAKKRTTNLQTQDRAERPLLIVGSVENPLVQVFRHQPSDAEGYEDVALNPNISTSLQAFLNQAPNLAANAVNMMSTRYVLQFAPEVTRGLANGTLSMMRSAMVQGGIRAMAVSADGTIVGQATMLAASAANPLTVGLVVWQVMAVVTAQKFLVDINNRLASLEKAIESVKNLLDNERQGKLLGNVEYLQRMADILQNQNVTDEQISVYVQKLEDIDCESLQVLEALRLQMEGHEKAFREQPLTSGVFSGSVYQNSDAAKRIVQDHDRAACQYLLGLYVGGMVAQLRSALPISRQTALSHVEHLHQLHTSYRESVKAFHGLVEERIPQLKGKFTFSSTDTAHQKQLGEQLESISARFQQVSTSVEQLTTQTRDAIQLQLSESGKPLNLTLSLGERGEIVRVQKVVEKRAASTDNAHVCA